MNFYVSPSYTKFSSTVSYYEPNRCVNVVPVTKPAVASESAITSSATENADTGTQNVTDVREILSQSYLRI